VTVLAIDPGNAESAYALIDHDTRRPLNFGKAGNFWLLDRLGDLTADHMAIEMVASYGMPVGADVFETVLWTGRYTQAIATGVGREPMLVKRLPVKVHHCGSARAKDSNIVQALVDRFAPGAPNRGKGTKAAPGWFYGFRADIWQAYALAVHVADTTPLAAATTSTPVAARPDAETLPHDSQASGHPTPAEALW
jgi:hypothetical protein